MKYRVLDVMNEALGLVKKSDLGGATALIRKALSGESAPAGENGDSSAPPPRPSAKVIPLRPRRPLGETLRALRVRPMIPPSAPEPAEREPAPDFGEGFLRRAYRGPAGSLDYRLYVPADHEQRELALVLMLHGCTQDPEDFALGTRMNDLAEEFGLIVAYPHQTRLANPSGCWNWFDRRHQKRGSGEPAKLAGLAQALAKEFNVRRERVFAAGLSAGGAMAEILAATYPNVECALIHKDAWQLLVATILSAQCTDARVNMVTPVLFKRFPTPADLAAAPIDEIKEIIRTTGFYNNKAKSIQGAAKKIIADFKGKVPRTMEELLTVPGAARKTANVVLGTAFGLASGVVVDTHVKRLARRLGLSGRNTPEKIEQDLMDLVPRAGWVYLSHRLIHHGRRVCVARRPRCDFCSLAAICPKIGVTAPPKAAKTKPPAGRVPGHGRSGSTAR